MIGYQADIPVLQTERLTLRLPQARDLDVLAPFVMSDRAGFVGGGADKPLGYAWRVLAIFIGHWHLHGFGLYVFDDRASGKPLGAVGPWYPAGWPQRELSWAVWDPAAEGSGFAAEAVTRIRDHLNHDLGWPELVSYIDPANTRSIALAERLGARRDPDAQGDRPTDLVYRHPVSEVAV